MGGKLWISVGDYLGRYSKPFVHMFEVQLGNAYASDTRAAGDKYRCTRAPVVYDGEDCIFAMSWGQPCDEIHCYVFEGSCAF